ncbi:MAG: hypothetical protein [Chaetfec virus UA24_2329]|nr:MAG: hypothetical protein [Chaetfec virus UA24_2329]
MRIYEKREYRKVPAVPSRTVPGFRLSEVIDQFYAEGVVPDFLPADLGEDTAEEFDSDGFPIVDPDGNIRTDPMDARERALMKGVDEFETSLQPPVPVPVPVPEPASEPTE